MIGKCAHLSPKAKKWSRKRNPATESFYMLTHKINSCCCKHDINKLKTELCRKAFTGHSYLA
jgi:hypothetical protein